MKTIFYKTLPLFLAIGLYSCKSNKMSDYQRLTYQSDKEYSDVMANYSMPKKKLATNRSNNDCCGKDETTFTANLRSIPRSAGDETNVDFVTSSPTTPTRIVPKEVVKPSYEGVPFRTGRLHAVDSRDQNKIKKYNTVIVTLSVPSNVERLKRKLDNLNEYFIIAKNERGWYCFIVNSSDNEDQTVAERNAFVDRYIKRYGGPNQLFKIFGMPFTDSWIQVNE